METTETAEDWKIGRLATTVEGFNGLTVECFVIPHSIRDLLVEILQGNQE